MKIHPIARLALGALGLGLGVASAQDDVRADLQATLDELAAQRTAVAEEKAALLQRYHAAEARVRELRREWEMVRREATRAEESLRAREDALAQREASVARADEMLADFRGQWGASLPAAELPARREALAVPGPEGDHAVLSAALERLHEAPGGTVVPAQAVAPGGEILDGQVFVWGPVAFFAADRGLAGHAVEGEGLLPNVAPFADSDTAEALARAFDGQAASLPLDATLGQAGQLRARQETLAEHLRSGGLWVWPILALAALAVLVMAAKFMQIARARLPEADAVDDWLAARRENTEGAEDAHWPRPARELLSAAWARRDAPRAVLEDVLLEHIIRWQLRWESWLPALSVTAATTPLLGLLGTVTGMIATFRLVGVYGSGDARPLSAGISEALVTTELGLLVAIPALLAHALLSRKAQSLVARLEDLAARAVDRLHEPTEKEDSDA